ncbi:hypothetical protein L211DRAFT_853480 [Terfezia boudieri ATCC MYA-4762]|uniref:Uncharacterized protein n=1 Tax=Terfezia boudieri ATCC MYA-4762 TaxID=1051890 RepID=A0A3N4L8B2_9PEZI|nr:hypothetical protein L211DRAFT_853480 [Terfezia boudieri ATCC MYA-4762]
MSINNYPLFYDLIYASLKEKLSLNPSPGKIVDAIYTLPLPAYEILMSGNQEDDLLELTPEEKLKFQTGVAKAMSSNSDEAIMKLQESANEAILAVNVAETIFTNMTRDLASIDANNTLPTEGPFAPCLTTLHEAFHGTIDDSRMLAVKLGLSSRPDILLIGLDEVIIPICNNKNLTTEARKAKVEVFINDANRFATESKAISERFQKLKDNFAIFIGSFSGWTKDKEKEDTKELEQARLDLANMNSKLSKLNISLYAMAGFTAIALSATAQIGGLIAAGIGLTTTIALFSAIENLKGKISDKEEQIKTLSEEIAQLKAARTNLEKLGTTNLENYSQNLIVISLLWTAAKNDAVKVKEWLEQGAEDAVNIHTYSRYNIET